LGICAHHLLHFRIHCVTMAVMAYAINKLQHWTVTTGHTCIVHRNFGDEHGALIHHIKAGLKPSRLSNGAMLPVSLAPSDGWWYVATRRDARTYTFTLGYYDMLLTSNIVTRDRHTKRVVREFRAYFYSIGHPQLFHKPSTALNRAVPLLATSVYPADFLRFPLCFTALIEQVIAFVLIETASGDGNNAGRFGFGYATSNCEVQS